MVALDFSRVNAVEVVLVLDIPDVVVAPLDLADVVLVVAAFDFAGGDCRRELVPASTPQALVGVR